MSTDLYGIRILDVTPAEKKITLRIFVVYYDVMYKKHQPLPKDNSFFLRVLLEAGSEAAIGKEISEEQFLNEEWVDSHTYQFIDHVVQLSTDNFPLTDYTGYKDFYYFRAGGWEDENKLVQAKFDVFVTDIRYLENLKAGMAWGTTGYETSATILSLQELRFLPHITVPVKILEPFHGLREKGTPHGLIFSPDSKQIIASSRRNELVALEVGSWKERWRKQDKGKYGELIATRKQNLVWLQNQKSIQVHDLQTGKTIKMVPEKIGLMSPKGKYYFNFNLSAFHNADYLVFLDEKEQELWRIPQPAEIETVCFSSDDKLAAIATFEEIDIWDLEKRMRFRTIKTNDIPSSTVYGHTAINIVFDPTGKYLAIIFFQSIEVYNLVTGVKVLKYDYPKDGNLGKACWSADGKYFALINVLYPSEDVNVGGRILVYQIGIGKESEEK